MSETAHGDEQEVRPELVRLDKLAESNIKDLSTPAVIFVPAIHGQPLTPDILDQFSQSNIDFWNTQIIKYGYPDADAYIEEMVKEIKQNPDIPSVDNNLYLMGYSAGAVLAAETGKALGLPPEKVLLIAPAYQANMFRGERTKLLMKRIKGMFSKNRDSANEPGGAYIRRVLGQTDSSLYGGETRQSRLPGVRKFKEFSAWNKVQKGSQLGRNHLELGTIFNGKNDIISPSTKHSVVGVYAGHGFKDFVPAVTQYIETRSK